MHNAAIITRSLLAASLAVSMLHPAAAMADGGLHTTEAGSTLTDSFMEAGSARKQGWDVAVGGGLVYLPTFEGSDRYTTNPLPFVHATWNDRISIGTNGLSAYWRHDRLRYGAALTYGGGRKDTKGNGVSEMGDDRLRGLGIIKPALGIKAFATYDAGPVMLSGALTKFTGNQNDGVLMNLGASKRFKLNERWSLTPHAGATWANQSYTQTFYGVTPTQAANSSFAAYSAGSGFKDVSAGINATYQIDDHHWFVSTSLAAKRLVGDAAKSPISISDSQTTLMMIFGYRF